MSDSFPVRRALAGLALLAAASVAACSGGGSSSSPANPSPPLGGIGSTVAFNQRVNFTVLVPPQTTLNAVAARRKHLTASTTATTTNPYVSPNTGSVSLQIVTVNGVSPQTLPAVDTVNVTCGSANGCSIPIQNVPAATGVNRFSVQTFSGTGGTGNLISSGFIDVTAPSSQATSFGGTSLTIGGFAQSLLLTLTEPAGGFVWHTAATGTVDVNAVDPAGAIIIGSAQLANPIAVSLPTTDESAFTIGGQQQLTLQQPAQAISLAYNGTVLFGGTVSASTLDENSQPVATSLPIPITAPKTPAPTPVPSTKPALSLYVYDASADRVIEYAGVNDVEGGQPFNTTPRRIFEVAAPNPQVSCPPIDGITPAAGSIAVSSTGTIYVQTYCTDNATSTLGYTFTYAAGTQESVPPQASPTPPVPTTTFSVPVLAGPYGAFALGIKLAESQGTAFLQYGDSLFGGLGGTNIIGVSLANPTTVTTNLGASCMQVYGAPDSCTTGDNAAAYGQFPPFNFAADANGNLYLPSNYPSSNSTSINPPGSTSQQFIGEPAVLVFPPGGTNPAPTPLSVLAGFSDELGAVGEIDAIEGTTLYVYSNQNATITPPGSTAGIQPGLSGCPAPSANATPDIASILCADTLPHDYIAGFVGATQTLTASANNGVNVVTPPTFMLGGDQVGGFGDGSSTPGDLIAVRDGFVFVLNPSPPSGTQQPEIDVYNTNNGLTGFHTDIPPIAKLLLSAPIVPTTIAIGPTGTGIGGEALLRRPARVHHDVKAWARQLQQRRNALLQRRRRPGW